MNIDVDIIPTCCNACGGQTGILAHVMDGKVIKLEPNAENPIGVANTWDDFLVEKKAIFTGEPYQPKAAVFVFQNYVMSVPNSQRNIEAIKKLEFVMAIDVYHSETAEMADLVIPGTHFLERYDLTANWVAFPSISLRQPVIKPLHGGLTEYEFIMSLAQRMGLPGFDMPYKDLLNAELKGSAGISLDELKRLPGAVWNQGPTKYRKFLNKGFATSSGKFEFFSEVMADKGLDPLPHIEIKSGNDLGSYPLALINWKSVEHTHTRTQNNPWLMEMRRINPLWMHPLTAESLSLKDSDIVSIESTTGECCAILKITPEIHPDAVGMSYGFGHKNMGSVAKGSGTNVNQYYEGKAEHISGQAIIKEAWVRVRKAGGHEVGQNQV